MKFRFMHTNTFCKYRKKLLASPRVHLVPVPGTFGARWCKSWQLCCENNPIGLGSMS